MSRSTLTQARRWVVKIGSSLLTAEGRGLDHDMIDSLTRQIAALKATGAEVVLVSSGSIAEGLARLGFQQRPTAVHELQAAAAIGQMGLIRAYEAGFERFGILAAQILLTHDDLANRRRYLNARATIQTLLAHGALPIVNENDTVTTSEIKLGDNDTLGAQVANLIGAEVLILLTDQQGLYDKDPRHHADARLIDTANASDPAVLALAGPPGSHIGSGGMRTKILAAERAANNGTATVVAHGQEPDILPRLQAGESIGTLLTSNRRPQDARKRWLHDQLRGRGRLTLDAGACRALREKGTSLLAAGVIDCQGEFSRGELVSCHDQHGEEVARGLINYSASDTRRVLGQPSRCFEALLGYVNEPELIDRDNMIVLSPAD